MQKAKGKSNAQTLFIMDQIPSDNHIRDLMDVVHPSYVFPMFSYIFDGLNALGYLEEFSRFHAGAWEPGDQYYLFNIFFQLLDEFPEILK